MRSYDYVGRYGGEEFLVILNNCDALSAPGRAEEMRNAISEFPIQTEAGPFTVTTSIGVHQTENWGFRSIETPLHEVDAALYAAKAAGRNFVRFVEPGNVVAGENVPVKQPAETLS